MFVRAARTLGFCIIGMAISAVGMEAVGGAQESDAPAVPKERVSSLPVKVLKEQIPTLPAKILREKIPTLPTKIGKQQIITLPAKAAVKSANTTPPMKAAPQEVIPTLPTKDKKSEGFQDPIGGSKAVDKK
jgi:hypothetical protein